MAAEIFELAGIAAFVFVASAWSTAHFARPDSRMFILDHPNSRSLHDSPTPRSGGVAILLSISLGLSLAWLVGLLEGLPLLVGSAVLLIAGISLRDDIGSVAPIHRLLVHFVGAGLVLIGAGVATRLSIPNGQLVIWAPLAGLFQLIFVVWTINLYNFMDGMDGFAGGMAVIGFLTFAGLGWYADAGAFAATSLLVSSSAAGFLLFNFPPSRIFMGDVGASTLGFLVAVFTIWAEYAEVFPLWIGVLVFSPFYVDATATLLRRLFAGERVWEPHRSHYYQRLVQLGWGHRRTVVSEYLLMIACSLSAGVAAFVATPTDQWLLMGGWIVTYSLLMTAIALLEARARLQVGKT